jgi:hypothetical protein
MAEPLKLYNDKNKLRYTYRKSAYFNRAQPLGEGLKTVLINRGTSIEIEVGVALFTTSIDQVTVTFVRTFSSTPGMIMTSNGNTSLSVTLSSTSATIYSSSPFSGKVYWMAANKEGVSGRPSTIFALEGGSTAVTSAESTVVTFTDAQKAQFDAFSNAGDTVAFFAFASTNGDVVNSFVTAETTSGFTASASEIFTGTMHWLAVAAKNI